MILKTYITAIVFCCLAFPFNLFAKAPLYISLGDNYGKHAMIIDDKPAGIQKELLEWFFRDYMGINIVLESMPWKRAQAVVEQTKQSDGYFTAYTDERVNNPNLLVSRVPFYVTKVKMHSWRGNPNSLALSRLENLDELLIMDQIRHVFLEGSGYHEEQFKSAKLVNRLNSIHQIAKYLLDYKRADIFVEQSELFYPVVEELGLLEHIQTFDHIKLKKLFWHLYIRKDSEHADMMDTINQSLDSATQDGALLEKVQEIFTKYKLSYEE